MNDIATTDGIRLHVRVQEDALLFTTMNDEEATGEISIFCTKLSADYR